MNNFIKNLGIGQESLIKKWLDKNGIKDYILDDEYRILAYDVKITIDGNLPEYINFKMVCDFTLCGTKNTTSLRGCPELVYHDFICRNCKNLKTLEGCPRIVHRNFMVENNGIEDIKEYPFFPQQAYRVCLYGNPITTDHKSKQDLELKIYKICHTNNDILITMSLDTKLLQKYIIE
jgi:hypothetical protein